MGGFVWTSVRLKNHKKGVLKIHFIAKVTITTF